MSYILLCAFNSNLIRVDCSYMSSSDNDDEDAEVSPDDMEETAESEEGEMSDTSYDEGSYDGRQGKIVYTCTDDEAIAQGAPGAHMYDQNIRET